MDQEEPAKKPRLTDHEALQEAVAKLMIRFDTVQILVSRHDNTDEQTYHREFGDGNLYARYGQAREWCLKIDEYSKCQARQEVEDDE